MKKGLCFTLATLVVALLCSTLAGAATLTYSDSKPMSLTDWTYVLTLPKFNPDLGVLTGIRVTMDSSLQGTAKVESLDSSPTTVTTTLSAQVSLSNGVQLLTAFPLVTRVTDLSAYDGVRDYAGTSGITYPDLQASESSSAMVVASDINYFVGTGNLTLNASATSRSTGSGSANLAVSLRTYASASVTVEYYYEPFASLGDYVWEDSNGNGIQDIGEAGIAGIKVYLLDTNGLGVKSTTTDANGYYLFDKVAPGSYYVQFDRPDAYLFSPALQGSNPAADSNANAAGLTDVIVLASGEHNPTVDAGLVPSSLGDFVWNDLNGNGFQDSNEPGIAGVEVELQDTGGNVLTTAITNQYGYYLFPKLAPGEYVVKFNVPDDYVLTAKGATTTAPNDSNADQATGLSDTIVLGPGEINLTIDAGMYIPGSIGDFVWFDMDADGVQDAGEPGIAGVTINLYDAGDNLIASVVTDDNGEYDFSNLPAGEYTVKVDAATLPAGLNKSTYDLDGISSQNTAGASLAIGQNREDVDFGYTGTGSIGDRVWLDKNNNGAQDSGEVGIKGVTVTLTGPYGITLTTTTGTDGIYKFDKLPAGEYTITVDSDTLPSGLTPTFDLDGIATAGVALATLAAMQNRSDVDFGYSCPQVKPVKICGYVYIDANANGCLNTGEPAKAGVTVTLTGTTVDGKTIAPITAVTDANGYYHFDNLAPGNYVVTETVPSGYVATNALPGTAGTKVSSTQIKVAATNPGSTYCPQNFLIRGDRPGVEIVKTGPATAKVGETITYHFVVTNTGNTYLYGGVTVNDPMLGGNIWHKTPVAPGEVNEFDKTYTVKSSDPECLVNTATAIGCPPTGCKVTDTSSWTVKIVKNTCTYVTYAQCSWGSSCSPANKLLSLNFCKLYKCGLVIGGCKTLKFTSAYSVSKFLPQSGTPSKLCKSLVNPTCRTSAGSLAGQVLALKLNVDFSNKGITCKGLGDLKLKSGKLAGWTVNQVLTLGNTVLGGNTRALPRCLSISDLNSIIIKINENFDNGKVNKGYLK